MTDKEYLEKYQKEYGTLDDKRKEYQLDNIDKLKKELI